jgi:hypothetical protein
MGIRHDVEQGLEKYEITKIDGQPTDEDLNLLMKELTLRGSIEYPARFENSVDLLARRDLSALITHRFGLEQFNDALAVLDGSKDCGKVLIGECWDSSKSGDKSFEIMVSPTEADPVRVLGILVHELAHAAAGLAAGHSGDFETLARGLHLEGPLPATTVGDAFKTQMAPALERLGEYPHAELNTAKKDTQSTRLLLCRCMAVMHDGYECGYTVRLTAKWLKGGKDRKDGSKESFGPPICPGNGSGHHGSMSVA